MCLAKRAERAYIPALSALVACTRLFLGSIVSGEGAAQLTGVFCSCAAAEANQRDQRLPADGAAEGRTLCEDKKVWGCDQVQGPLQALPVHALRHRRGQGRQAEAVAATRCALVFCVYGCSCLSSFSTAQAELPANSSQHASYEQCTACKTGALLAICLLLRSGAGGVLCVARGAPCVLESIVAVWCAGSKTCCLMLTLTQVWDCVACNLQKGSALTWHIGSCAGLQVQEI